MNKLLYNLFDLIIVFRKMNRFIGLILSALMIPPGIATSSAIVDKVMGLYFRVMKPTETSQISISEQFSGFETSMGEVMLGMWFDQEDESSQEAQRLEKRFTEYISSCSRGFAGSIFGNFIRTKINAPIRSALEERALSLQTQLLEIRRKLKIAHKEQKILRREIYPIFSRFGPVYEYLRKLRPFYHKPVRSFNILEDKKEYINKLAEKLRDCPNENVKRAQTYFIRYIERVQKRHSLTAGALFELCKDAFYDIIDRPDLKLKLYEIQNSIDLLQEAHNQTLNQLDSLNEQLRML